MLTVPMMGNPDPEAKEDQTVYEVLVNRELPIVTSPDGPHLLEKAWHVMKQNEVHLRHMPQVGTKDHINSGFLT